MSDAETAGLRDRIEELERLLGMRPVLPRIWGLTAREADVLGILLKRQVMSQTQLFEAIWGGDSDRETKIVEVMICKLAQSSARMGSRSVPSTASATTFRRKARRRRVR